MSDVRAAVDFYTNKLGFRVGFTWGDPPTIAGVNLGNVQMFLEQGMSNPAGCAVYFVVGNADELYEFQRANGVDVIQTPGDRPVRFARLSGPRSQRLRAGVRTASLQRGTAIEIERVDVPVRLEKRLAALLYDLAEYKRLSLSSCLEETLLHTLDGVGTAHEGAAPADPETQREARDRLRQPRQLPVCRAVGKKKKKKKTIYTQEFDMVKGLATVIYGVTDLEKAKAWYASAFQQAPYFDQPFYVGFISAVTNWASILISLSGNLVPAELSGPARRRNRTGRSEFVAGGASSSSLRRTSAMGSRSRPGRILSATLSAGSKTRILDYRWRGTDRRTDGPGRPSAPASA